MQRSTVIHEILTRSIEDAKIQNVIVGKNNTKDLEMIDLNSSETDKKAQSTRRKRLDDDDDDLGSVDFEEENALSSTLRKKESFGGEISFGSSDLLSSKGDSAFSLFISESSDVLLAVSDLSNARSAKLIGVRADQNAQLNPKDFYRLLSATREFINGSENITGHHCFGLKGAMLSQVGFIY